MAPEPARERILRTADDLFFTEGIVATGVNRLIEDAGVAKASFYSNFKSKNDLVDAYLEKRHYDLMERFDAIESSADSIEIKFVRVFDLLSTAVVQNAYRGCTFVVAAVEMPQESLPAKRWVRTHKLAVRDCFCRMLTASDVPNASELAEQLALIYDGALVMAAVRPESRTIERARSMVLTLIANARAVR
ncbi:TetR/AcrR family transcriptional regulator [Rhodococcus koreensis]